MSFLLFLYQFVDHIVVGAGYDPVDIVLDVVVDVVKQQVDVISYFFGFFNS